MTINDGINPVLRTWDGLNAHLMTIENEAALEELLQEELKGRNRVKFVSRIYSRLNRVRACRERWELGVEYGKKD